MHRIDVMMIVPISQTSIIEELKNTLVEHPGVVIRIVSDEEWKQICDASEATT